MVGVAFAASGVYRLFRPRRGSDVDWIRRNQLANWMLGGLVVGFDRAGALMSIVIGVAAMILGVAVLAA